MTRSERREHLTRRHGFECACAELCDRDEAEIEATDRLVVEAAATFGSALALARRIQTKRLPNASGLDAEYLALTSKLEDAIREGKVGSVTISLTIRVFHNQFAVSHFSFSS